jgi:hypothetical protein
MKRKTKSFLFIVFSYYFLVNVSLQIQQYIIHWQSFQVWYHENPFGIRTLTQHTHPCAASRACILRIPYSVPNHYRGSRG